MQKFVYFVILSSILIGCSNLNPSNNSVLISENIIYRKYDSLNFYSFPPRAVSLNDSSSKINSYAQENNLLSKDSIIVDSMAQVLTPWAPVYPEMAKKYGLDGLVYLRVHVTPQGYVRKAAVIGSTSIIFDEAALNAIMKWYFSPAYIKNKAIDVSVIVPLKFKLFYP